MIIILMINKMSDLYGSTDQAVALGNMRHKAVRDLNDRVREHNQQVTTTIQSLKDQVQNNATIKEAQDVAQNLWTGHGMPQKIQAYQDWRAGKTGGTNPAQGQINTQKGVTAGEDLASENQAKGLFGKGVTPGSGVETVDTSNIPVTAKDYDSAGNEVSAGESLGETDRSLGGIVKSGISRVTGVSKGALEEGLEMAGKGATVVGALGIGGMDVYNEYKSLSEGKGLSGDNWQEKAGNLLQLGGAVSDIVGTAFPPAKLLGGILDLSAGALDVVGEKMAEGQKEGELDTEGQAQQEQGIAQQAQATAVTGRTQ